MSKKQLHLPFTNNPKYSQNIYQDSVYCIERIKIQWEAAKKE